MTLLFLCRYGNLETLTLKNGFHPKKVIVNPYNKGINLNWPMPL